MRIFNYNICILLKGPAPPLHQEPELADSGGEQGERRPG